MHISPRALWEATLKRELITRLLLSWYQLQHWSPLFLAQPAFPERSSASDSLHFKRSLWVGLWGPQQRARPGRQRLKDGWKMERDRERWGKMEREPAGIIKPREADRKKISYTPAVWLLFVLETLWRWPCLVPVSAQMAPMGPCTELVSANWAC